MDRGKDEQVRLFFCWQIAQRNAFDRTSIFDEFKRKNSLFRARTKCAIRSHAVSLFGKIRVNVIAHQFVKIVENRTFEFKIRFLVNLAQFLRIKEFFQL